MGRTRSGAYYSATPRYLRRAYAAGVIANAARRYMLRRRSQQQKVRGRYGIGVTNQFDRANVYRKKRMPRKKRKRWTKFVKKVKSAENTTLGTRTRIFNSQIQLSQTSSSGEPKQQLFDDVALYSCGYSDTNPGDDLHTIMNGDTDVAASGKIQMISGVMDMTLVNTSVDSTGNAMAIELDVYVCTVKKRLTFVDHTGTSVQSSLSGALNDANKTAGQLVATSTKINTADRGATPFDFTTGLSSFGVKIWSKKKYFLPSGNQMTYQMRDPRNHQLSKDDVLNINGKNKPGVTKFLILVAKGLPGAAVDGPSYNVRVNIGITRKYAYKLNEDDEDKTANQ